jgi:hypothetical protein
MFMMTLLKIIAFAGYLTFTKGRHPKICIKLSKDHRSVKAYDKHVFIAA